MIHGAGDLRVTEWAGSSPGPDDEVVAVRYGGICGSDLHYWRHGGVGDFRLREPMVLGHEVVGVLADGTEVAVHPATPCQQCPECLAGRANVCRDTRYLGSAARNPHVQGGFTEQLVVPAAQLRPLPPGLPIRRAALAEPLAVAIHAVRRAGDIAGRSVLVTGSGPIGCLVVAAAKAAGAASIVATDLLPQALEFAMKAGATEAVLAGEPVDEVDVAIEASGAAAGLANCLRQVRRGGVLVQLGMLPPGNTPLPGNLLVSKEIDLRGTFRFDIEFDDALRLLAVTPSLELLISAVLPLADAEDAFELAADRGQSCKVLLDFTRA